MQVWAYTKEGELNRLTLNILSWYRKMPSPCYHRVIFFLTYLLHQKHIQLDYIDAKVGAVLCPGGVCNYVVVDPACTAEWITTHVTPETKAVLSTVGIIIG